MLTLVFLGLLLGMNNANPITGGPVPCDSPAPESIAPCTCSVDTETNSRTLICEFEFANENDVTEMVENIFAQFDESNNKFDAFNLNFLGADMSNFAFNEKTTGRLETNAFRLVRFCIRDQQGPMVFTDSAWVNSRKSMKRIQLLPFCPENPTYSFAPGFLADLENLTFLMMDYYDYSAQPFPQSGVQSLTHVILGKVKLGEFLPGTFPMMPNLEVFEVDHTGISKFPAGIIENFPVLKEFWSINGDVEVVEAGFFKSMTDSRSVYLVDDKITSIDLTGLSPYTEVNLEGNAITQLTEKNFKPFVDGVLNTADATGKIILINNPLECSCDLKWLVADMNAVNVFKGAVCADGTPLENIDADTISDQC